MIECVAVIPAKASSRRVPGKNTRPFWRGLSLLEIKLRVLSMCDGVGEVVVSSDDMSTLRRAERLGARPVARRPDLCGDHVALGALFEDVLREYHGAIVYWAHATSPFVSRPTVNAAVALVREASDTCAVGVEELNEFLWDERGPHNYDPMAQPRSQDLPRLWRVTGGIHVARGGRFVSQGALVFDPVRFVTMTRLEGLDINTEDDWELCRRVADSALPELLG